MMRKYSLSDKLNFDSFKDIFSPPFVEVPFWIAFAIWAFLPATKTPWFDLGTISINGKDCIILGLGIFYWLLHTFVKSKLPKSNWTKKLPTVFLLIITYALTSTMWSQSFNWDVWAMRYTLVTTTFTFLLSFFIIAQKEVHEIRSFLSRLSIALAITGTVYFAESFWDLGLREISNIYDFGIERVRGPLFGASVGHFILIPALAFSVDKGLNHQVDKWFWLIISSLLCMTILGLGARAGVISLFIFFVFIVIGQRKLVEKYRAILLTLAILLISFIVVFSRADILRFKSFEDRAREENHLASLDLIRSQKPIKLVSGDGYGSVWPWYIPDTENTRATGQYISKMIYGQFLYHPHSVPLLLIVELGFVGLLFFLYFVSINLKIYLESIRLNRNTILNACLVTVCASMFFDLIIFKNWVLSAIWWLYFFGVLRIHDFCKNSPSISEQESLEVE